MWDGQLDGKLVLEGAQHRIPRNKKLLGAPGIATSNKDATNGAPETAESRNFREP